MRVLSGPTGVCLATMAILGAMVSSVEAGFGSQLRNAGFLQQGSSAERAIHWESGDGGMWGGSARSGWNGHDGDGFANLIKGAWGGFNYAGSWQDAGGVQAGSRYEFAAWFLRDNGWSAASCVMKIEWLQNGTLISSSELPVSGLAEGRWVKKYLVATAPTSANSAHVVLVVSGIGSSGAMYMDEVSFGKLDTWVYNTGAVPNGGFFTSWNTWGGAVRTNWNHRDGNGWSTLFKGAWGGNNYAGIWAGDCTPLPKGDYEIAAWFYVDNGWRATNLSMRVEWFWKQYYWGCSTFAATNLVEGQWALNSFVVPNPMPFSDGYAHYAVSAEGIGPSGALYVDAVRMTEAVPVSDNRIRNGGFEAGVFRLGNRAMCWYDDGGSSWGSAARLPWKPYSGKYSATLQGAWSGFNYGGWWQHCPVTPGVTYTASAQLFRESTWTAQSGQLKIEWYDDDNNQLGVRTLDVQGMTPDAWTLKTLSGTAPAQAKYAIIAIEASGIGSNGTFYIDELRFQ